MVEVGDVQQQFRFLVGRLGVDLAALNFEEETQAKMPIRKTDFGLPSFPAEHQGLRQQVNGDRIR